MHLLQRVGWVASGALLYPFFAGSVSAQLPLTVSPDTTLGADSSRVVPGVMIRGALGDRIDGGALRGTNLFHSFSEFSIGEGGRVYFTNPVGVETIFSRVTGQAASQIFGTLGVDGGASLYLLNPHGILFGPNARLDIAGSFVGTTASELTFGDGLSFSAANPGAAPLLNLNVRPGLQLGAQAGPIESTALLQVGGELRLVAGSLDLSHQVAAGGDLTLQAQDTLRIRDSVTQPFVAAAGGNLLVQGDRSVDIFALNHPGSGLFSGGNMVLRSPNPVLGDAHYFSGGNFSIQQPNGQPGDLVSPFDPIILTFGDVTIDNYTGTSLHVLAGGRVTLGDVTITGPDLTGNAIYPAHPNAFVAGLATVTLADGSSQTIDGTIRPTLDIRSGIDWSIFGGWPNPLASNIVVPDPLPPFVQITGNSGFTATDTEIAVGNINTTAAQDAFVFLSNRVTTNPLLPTGAIRIGNIDTSVNSGTAGDVLVDAVGDILVRDIKTFVGVNGAGSAGDITLFSAQGGIDTTFGEIDSSATIGLGGNIKLEALDNISTDNIKSFIGADGIGVAGDIELTSFAGTIDTRAGTLISATDDGFGGDITLKAAGDILPGNIQSFSNGLGDAGDIEIRSGGDIILGNVQLTSQTNGSGDAGKINLEADRLLMVGSELRSATTSTGDAGSVTIRANDIELSQGSIISARIDPGGGSLTTKAGDVSIQGRRLRLTDGSQVQTALFRTFDGKPGGQGIGGNVLIRMQDEVIVDGTSPRGFSTAILSLAERGSLGAAGNILVETGNLILSNGAGLGASTFSSATSGDVVIRATTVDLFNGGKILASSGNGRQSPGLLGNAGSVDITARDRISIFGEDPNYDTRLANINTYLTTIGQGDEPEDVLGLRQNVGDLSGLFVFSDSNGATGDVSLSAPQILMDRGGFIVADAYGSSAGGSVLLRSQNLQLTGGAEVLARTFGPGKGGDITAEPLDLQQTSLVRIAGIQEFTGLDQFGNPNGGFSSGFGTNAEDGSTGRGGTIQVTATNVILEDGGVLSARTRGAGAGGDVTVNATNVEMTGGGQILTPTFFGASAGSITVNVTGNVTISGSDPSVGDRLVAIRNAIYPLIESNLLNQGISPDEAAREANRLAIRQARFTVDAINPASGLQSTVEFETRDLTGPPADIGGDIRVTTGGDLRLDNFAQISVGTSGRGNAGDLQFNVGGAMVLDGQSTIRAVVEGGAVGNGGDIDVKARSLSLLNGSQIGTVLFRETKDASGTITPGAIGKAGDIRINVQDAALFSGFKLDTSDPAQPILLASGLLAGTERGAQGPGGNITLSARQLSLVDRAGISAATQNASKAGNINLTISELLNLTNGGRISVAGFDTGDPGNITIQAGAIRMANLGAIDGVGSSIDGFTESGRNANLNIDVINGIVFSCCNNQISAEAKNFGDGGNIRLNVGGVGILTRLEDNNDIVANAYAGAGGNITANVRGPVRSFRQFENTIGRTAESDFIASSELGVNGSVEIKSINPDVRPTPPVTPDFVPRLSTFCSPEGIKERQAWKFFITGKGGITETPSDPRGLSEDRTEWIMVPIAGSTYTPDHFVHPPLSRLIQLDSSPALQEASHWQLTPTGQLELVAQAESRWTPEPYRAPCQTLEHEELPELGGQ